MFLKSCCSFFLFVAVLFASQPVTALLHDGSQVRGTFTGDTADSIRVEVAGQMLTLPVKSIDAVQFESPAGAPALSSHPESASATSGSPIPAPAIQIPAGTEIVVRLIDPVDSARGSVRKLFRASVDQPITSSQGDVLIPRGADRTGSTDRRTAIRAAGWQDRAYVSLIVYNYRPSEFRCCFQLGQRSQFAAHWQSAKRLAVWRAPGR